MGSILAQTPESRKYFANRPVVVFRFGMSVLSYNIGAMHRGPLLPGRGAGP